MRPHYYEGRRGRRPVGAERMPRMCFLQLWFDLSDEGVEDAVYDSRKPSTRSKVEHAFLVVKRWFGYAKCRYRSIAKNARPSRCSSRWRTSPCVRGRVT